MYIRYHCSKYLEFHKNTLSMDIAQATNAIITYEVQLNASATSTTLVLLSNFWITTSTSAASGGIGYPSIVLFPPSIGGLFQRGTTGTSGRVRIRIVQVGRTGWIGWRRWRRWWGGRRQGRILIMREWRRQCTPPSGIGWYSSALPLFSLDLV